MNMVLGVHNCKRMNGVCIFSAFTTHTGTQMFSVVVINHRGQAYEDTRMNYFDQNEASDFYSEFVRKDICGA